MKRRTYLASVAALLAGCNTQNSGKPTGTTRTQTRTETPTATSTTTTTETTTRTRTPTGTTTQTTQTPTETTTHTSTGTTTTTTTRTTTHTTTTTTTRTTTQEPEPQVRAELTHSYNDETRVHTWKYRVQNTGSKPVTFDPHLNLYLTMTDDSKDVVVETGNCIQGLEPRKWVELERMQYDNDRREEDVYEWEFVPYGLKFSDGRGCG